ncbi:hypothetical protein [Streptomyces sp. H34-S4]|uniref:hypothetical protein n=1 Tax=Streptomyces sp. H34-S4 TaxID=2996463 RepID=UPI002270157D|nr:hypothetical protein [Streptomyces sp. H34-S4]MCY0935156.1 hypothetical protein [Streptomyces sp. H34-S4]
MGEGGRLARGVVVRRLLAVAEASGSVSSLHVRVGAEAAGVSPRTVWRWLAEAREGRLEPAARQGRFALDDEQWRVLAEVGGNVAALYRRLTADGSPSPVYMPWLGTLHRVVQRDLGAGRVLEVARPSRNWVEAGPARTDPADIAFADRHAAHGNFRNWARLTAHTLTALERTGRDHPLR